MKAIMIMYDSLNRHMLAPYGCEWTKTPNFERLAERCVTFDKCYVDVYKRQHLCTRPWKQSFPAASWSSAGLRNSAMPRKRFGWEWYMTIA